MTSSEQISELLTALLAFHSEIGTIKKDSNNPFFKSKYASLDTIIETTKPILNKHGLVIVQCCHENGVTTTLFHTSGQFLQSAFSIEPESTKSLSKAQAQGVAITYNRRYSLSAMLNLATDEDVDGNVPPKNNLLQKKPEPISGETIETLLSAFLSVGLNHLDVEKELGHTLETMTQEELQKLRVKYSNIKKQFLDQEGS